MLSMILHSFQSRYSDKRTIMRIIYKTEEGGVAVIVPADTIEACMKDIPEGAKFEIVEDSDVPSDRTFRGAWTWA